jgi:hypothetical protein
MNVYPKRNGRAVKVTSGVVGFGKSGKDAKRHGDCHSKIKAVVESSPPLSLHQAARLRNSFQRFTSSRHRPSAHS